ncbi:MAG: hypothetical protein JXR96_12235 [Deltaproteobacteria bacterium]|nr:hypothetical protein [Deltaproteobacteria bacterium]
MRSRAKSLAAMLGLAFLLPACASRYYIHDETPSKAKNPTAYQSFYVSWLDLKEADWEKFGYGSQDEWAKVIQDENINGLQAYMKEVFPDKTLHFAGPGDESFPTQGDLYIKLDVEQIAKKWNSVTGGFDEIWVRVRLFDVASKEELYFGRINTTSVGVGPQGLTFEGRLGFAIYNLCCFIYDKLHPE